MKSELIGSLLWAVGMLALSFGGVTAHRLGYIDQETVTRLVTVAIGLWMVWFGNQMPKAMVRIRVPASAGQARRVAARSMVLSGLTYAGLWAFASIPVAVRFGTAAVLASVAVTLGYCVWVSRRTPA